MSKFEFDNDWGKSIGKAAKELANGRLPGPLGVVQDVVGHWAIARRDRSLIRYGKATLDTFGTLYTYYQGQKDVRKEGGNPSVAWLQREGYELAYSSQAYAFNSFIRRALDGIAFKNTTVKGDTERGELISFSIADTKTAFFVPSENEKSSRSRVNIMWTGPYIRKADKQIFNEFIRERVWSIMETNAIMISPSGMSSGSDSIELTALSDSIDYVCGKDEFNNVTAMAARCNAFLSKGISRNILFAGPPGTGKSTLARALARALDARAIVVDHEAVCRLTKSAHLLISVLGPKVVILNDIDRGDTNQHRELLNALELEFEESADLSLLTCITVNDINRLDPALLRPGRIHEIIEVPEPSPETVGLILGYYISKHKIDLTDEQRCKFIESGKGFSPADIREFCETARAVGTELAMTEIGRIRDQRKYYAGDKCKEFNKKTRG